MDMQPLLKLVCAKAASNMFDMSNDEITEYLDIECDLSEE